MLRIATLLTTGLLVTAVALAQEEPPPPVEGWTLVASGHSQSTVQSEAHTMYPNGYPGFFNYSFGLSVHRIVTEETTNYGNPSPITLPVWHTDLAQLANESGTQNFSGSVEVGYGVTRIVVEVDTTSEIRTQTFSYNLWSFQRMRSLDTRSVAFARIVTYD